MGRLCAAGIQTKIDWSGPGDEGPSETLSPAYGRL
jgi:hypothetical protein